MYKLFLTLRYLTRKKIVIFPILVVWLCLMMMIIVTSIMGGFVDRVRQANRDLLGDIIISSGDPVGWSGYDDLRQALAKEFPQIQESTPVVRAYGLGYFPRYNQTVPIQVVGINITERAKVSRFRETLFRQYLGPRQVAEDLAGRLPATNQELIDYARKKADQAAAAFDQADNAYRALRDLPISARKPIPNLQWLWGLPILAALIFLPLRPRPSRTARSAVFASLIGLAGLAIITLGIFWPVLFPHDFELAEDHRLQTIEDRTQADRDLLYAQVLPARRYASRQELEAILVPQQPSFAVPPSEEPSLSQPATSPANAPEGCIVGVQIGGGLFDRDKRGNFLRGPTQELLRLQVKVFPVQQHGTISLTNYVPQTFTIVDDSNTGVYDVNSTYVYAPFDTVQYMAGMRPDPDIVKDDPSAAFPPRCNELLIKLKEPTTSNGTRQLRAEIDKFARNYRETHDPLDFAPFKVQTWDERQAKYIGAVENEKTMMTFIMGLMSLVVLVVIFLIFYMIVRDKTRDIGIIKAVGGSETGVLAIFLMYGLFIGVGGGGLGLISGIAFVTHTNQIHEWIYRVSGIVIWDRSVYLFDRIPDVVNYREVIIYYILAMIAGVLGAAIPAIFAGLEDPVKAVRYE